MKHLRAWFALGVVITVVNVLGVTWSDLLWTWLHADQLIWPTDWWWAEGHWKEWARGWSFYFSVVLVLVAIPGVWLLRALHAGSWARWLVVGATGLAWAAVMQQRSGGPIHLPWSVCLLEASPPAIAAGLAINAIWPAESWRCPAWCWTLSSGALLGLALWSGPRSTYAFFELMGYMLLASPLWATPLLGSRWPQFSHFVGALLLLLGLAVLVVKFSDAGLDDAMLPFLLASPLLGAGSAHLTGWSWGQSSRSAAA